MNEEKREDLSFVIEILQQQKESFQSLLSTNLTEDSKKELLKKINSLKASQSLLNQCYQFNISPKAEWNVVPQPDHEWSEFRLLEDFDTDNMSDWKENSAMRLVGGEVVISNK